MESLTFKNIINRYYGIVGSAVITLALGIKVASFDRRYNG